MIAALVSLAIVGCAAFAYPVAVARPCRSWLRASCWLGCGLAALSCSGKAFLSTEASGGAAAGGSGSIAEAGSGFSSGGSVGGAPLQLAGASAMNSAGASTLGDAGASTRGGAAGASTMGGAAGADSPSTVDCSAFHGQEFAGHCYVDVTVEGSSPQQAQAIAACLQLASEHQVFGHLLVLDSPEEQSFVLKRLLVAFTDVSDAWLGLTCNQLDRPDINDCYCFGCSKAELAVKQRAWAWLAEGSSTFGWINGNPNGGYRCAALAYNPDLTFWGWVDRPCDKTSFAGSPGHTHGYRTLCELEP